MKKVLPYLSLIALVGSVSACGCFAKNVSRDSSTIQSSETSSTEDYSSFEWNDLDLSENEKHTLYEFEMALPFTCTKVVNGVKYVYSKTQKNQLVYGKTGDVAVYDRTMGRVYLGCGKSAYDYYDYHAKLQTFYEKIAHDYGKTLEATGYTVEQPSENYDKALEFIDVKLYDYYNCDSTKCSDGLMCTEYHGYDKYYDQDFFISSYADKTEQNVTGMFKGFETFEDKLSSVSISRSSTNTYKKDHLLTIKFAEVTPIDAQNLHKALLEIPGVNDITDNYDEEKHLQDYKTVVHVDFGGTSESGELLFSNKITVNYDYDKNTLSYEFNAASPKTSSFLSAAGLVKTKSGKITGYVMNSTGTKPLLPQTNEKYAAANTWTAA